MSRYLELVLLLVVDESFSGEATTNSVGLRLEMLVNVSFDNTGLSHVRFSEKDHFERFHKYYIV